MANNDFHLPIGVPMQAKKKGNNMLVRYGNYLKYNQT